MKKGMRIRESGIQADTLVVFVELEDRLAYNLHAEAQAKFREAEDKARESVTRLALASKMEKGLEAQRNTLVE